MCIHACVRVCMCTCVCVCTCVSGCVCVHAHVSTICLSVSMSVLQKFRQFPKGVHYLSIIDVVMIYG